MITGFEEFTEDIKASEMPTIRMIEKGLNARIGTQNAITNKVIRARLLETQDVKICGSKMRKYIQFIRVKKMVKHLCSNSKGYYRAKTKEEWTTYREGYRSRVKSMKYTLESMDEERFV